MSTSLAHRLTLEGLCTAYLPPDEHIGVRIYGTWHHFEIPKGVPFDEQVACILAQACTIADRIDNAARPAESFERVGMVGES